MLTYQMRLDFSFHFVCEQGRLLWDFVLAQAGHRAVRALAACLCDRCQKYSMCWLKFTSHDHNCFAVDNIKTFRFNFKLARAIWDATIYGKMCMNAFFCDFSLLNTTWSSVPPMYPQCLNLYKYIKKGQPIEFFFRLSIRIKRES